MIVFYTSKKGREVPVEVTRHALLRYEERCSRAYGSEPWPIEVAFARAQRLQHLGDHYRRRNRRHGRDTLYFQYQEVIFVVQNGAMVTVELCGKARRQNNAPAMRRE